MTVHIADLLHCQSPLFYVSSQTALRGTRRSAAFQVQVGTCWSCVPRKKTTRSGGRNDVCVPNYHIDLTEKCTTTLHLLVLHSSLSPLMTKMIHLPSRGRYWPVLRNSFAQASRVATSDFYVLCWPNIVLFYILSTPRATWLNQTHHVDDPRPLRDAQGRCPETTLKRSIAYLRPGTAQSKRFDLIFGPTRVALVAQHF